MAGYLQLAQVARAAHARIRSAQELESRWKDLGPERQEAARAEWTALRSTLTAVRDRLAAGPKGFVRGFGAGYRGEEVVDVPEARPLVELVRELHGATEALRATLDALPDADDDAPGDPAGRGPADPDGTAPARLAP